MGEYDTLNVTPDGSPEATEWAHKDWDEFVVRHCYVVANRPSYLIRLLINVHIPNLLERIRVLEKDKETLMAGILKRT